MQELPSSRIVDYSDIFQSFNSIFTVSRMNERNMLQYEINCMEHSKLYSNWIKYLTLYESSNEYTEDSLVEVDYTIKLDS